MLIGHYFSKLTSKGRTALPKVFRQQIGSTAIVARWYEGCLVVVSDKEWKELLNKLTAKIPVITKSVRETDRFIFGSAFGVVFDKQGRFVVPKVLRDYAGLKNQVIFVGLGDRIELWNQDAWDKQEAYVLEHAGDIAEMLVSKENRKGGDE